MVAASKIIRVTCTAIANKDTCAMGLVNVLCHMCNSIISTGFGTLKFNGTLRRNRLKIQVSARWLSSQITTTRVHGNTCLSFWNTVGFVHFAIGSNLANYATHTWKIHANWTRPHIRLILKQQAVIKVRDSMMMGSCGSNQLHATCIIITIRSST